jgi:hypothetical protein
LIKQYKRLPELLFALHPEHEWLPWKFDKSPNNIWDNVNNQRKFMDWVAKQFNINKMSDWYSVKLKVLKKL